MTLKIPDEWHKNEAFNCLTDEQWQLFREKYRIGDSFSVECDECGLFVIEEDGYHRCNCGNRRCVIYTGTYNNELFFYADV
jgi:hypothetical protein